MSFKIACNRLQFSLLFFLICSVVVQNLNAMDQGEIDSLMIIKQMKEGKIPGLALVIIQGDKETIKTFGYADQERNSKITESTLFELASCSKAFTALAFQQLMSEYPVKLNESVSQYLPWLKFYYKGKAQNITIEQLLHHTSGISWNTISGLPQGRNSNALKLTVETLKDIELNNTPGKQFEYATINYDILGLIIAEVSGMTYEAFVTEKIFKPLALNHTYAGRENVTDPSQIAKGYKINFFKARPYQAPFFKGNNPAGYIMSNPQDMAKWLKAQMELEQTELTSLIKKTHQRNEYVPPSGNTSYGMGWKVSLWGDGIIYHEGLNPNYATYVGFIPDRKIGVVILSNSNNSYVQFMGDQILYQLSNKVLPENVNPDSGPDKSFSIVSIMLSVYLLAVILYLGYVIGSVITKKRMYKRPEKSEIRTLFWLLLTILPCLMGIFFLPQAYNNFSWESIRVWAPGSFEVMVNLILLSIGLSYLNFAISTFFPDKNKFMRVVPQTVVISILSGIANMVLILLITSSVGHQSNLKYILLYFSLTIMIYIAGRSYVQRMLIGFTRNLVHEIRMNLISKILSTSYQKFEKIEKGRVLATVNGDIYVIGNIAYMAISFTTSVITVAGAFVYLATIAFWATILTLVLIATISLLYYVVSKRTRPLFEQARDTGNVLMNFLNDLLYGHKEISLNLRKKLEFRKDINDSSEHFKNKVTTAENNFVYAFLIGESLLILVLGISAFAIPVLFPEIKLYVLMSFIIILLYLIGPVNGILRTIPEILQFKIAWSRVQTFIKEIPSDLHIDHSINTEVPSSIDSFKVEDIKFSYDREGVNQKFSIGPVSLQVNAGEILFIAGGNGSGKSTLAKLLTGLYKPDSGTLRVNDRVIPSVEVGEFFSAVFSPSHLFKKLYSIDVEERDDEIHQHLEELELNNKVKVVEGRFDTLELSNGQLKRLALLQCYLEDKPIYLFDEWAADQDPEYRKFFYRTLLPKMKQRNKIIIAITHDDHYFDVADKILKMNLGEMEYLRVNNPGELVS